jgi:hypothetical protein
MIVPIPDETNATGIDKMSAPAVVFTTIGTRIVAPNIAHTCWIASRIHLRVVGLSPVPSIILLFSSTIYITNIFLYSHKLINYFKNYFEQLNNNL